MIIGVLNQKGGVGKTTISVNLAHALTLMGGRVLLVDADPQGSALSWSAVRAEEPLFPVVGMPKPTLHKDLPSVARDYDYVVIDGAPRVNELCRAAILASDRQQVGRANLFRRPGPHEQPNHLVPHLAQQER